ncbi:MAG: efflux transporter outer membrane subunit [Chlamydiia bacterium]|nr:efflux transporter outer membrane subunit [Chlamydiia bacterium]
MRKLIAQISIVSCGLWLTGCFNLGPDYCCPDARVACEWNNESGAFVEKESNGHCTWWRDFHDPVLNCLIEMASEENLDLQIACERINEARANLGIASGLRYPQLQRLFGKQITSQLSEHVPPLSILPEDIRRRSNSSNDLFTVSFDAMWELDIWGKYQKGVDAATAMYCAEVFGRDAAIVMVFAQVAQSYTTYRMLDSLMEVANESLVVQRRSLEIAEVRYRNGVSTELDVVQAQALLYETEALIPELQEGKTLAKNSLCALLALNSGELDCILEEGSGIPRASATLSVGLPCDLLRRRPDVRAAEQRTIAACAKIGIARTALLPSLSLAGTVGFASTEKSTLFHGDSLYWKHGFGIDWDILNYGRLQNAVCVEKARFEQAALAYKDAVLQAQIEVEDAFASIVANQEREYAFRKATEAAARSLDIALLQYREGEGEFDRVIDSERAWLAQRSELASVQAALTTSLIQLYKALGGGWQWRLQDCMLCDTAEPTQGEKHVR